MSALKYILVCVMFLSSLGYAGGVVNVYVWGGEIPNSVIHKFERQTGIRVNFATYDSNETLYAKLRASGTSIYDVILPSAYFVERMQKQGMLSALDTKQLPNLSNIDQHFIQNRHDERKQYSVPLTWGATGIFFNKAQISSTPKTWSDLWQAKWHNQLMVLDDPRELFAVALISLGYNPNDANPAHIKVAYEYLLALIPNIKLFAIDSLQAIMIDEDAIAGLAWTGDVLKAQQENPQIDFVFPKEGFMIWVDCLAIPINPPHPKEAYEFINFLLRPEIAAEIALLEGYAVTNIKAKALLPESIRTNPIVYPPPEVLKHGYVQHDLGEKKLAIYTHYWEQLKLAF